MRNETASTGITTAPSARASASAEASQELELNWLFPDWTVPPVRLARRGRMLLGRAEHCNIVLSGREISRCHAELRREGPLLLVQDRGSRNGVFVGGRRIHQAQLTAGDVMRLGEWIALVAPAVARSSTEETDAHTRPAADFREVARELYGGRLLSDVLNVLRQIAPTDLPVVIEGETGTGKEGTARALHAWSGRPGPLLAVNCAALPETLAEAELFGYRKGAFTGAERASPGYFRAAEGGTLLLDEVTDLPLAVQGKLLRALEQREVYPLGQMSAVPFDVRIVVAAQHSLDQAVTAGRFRADLYARLNGLALRLPPLRERIADVPPLFMLKLRKYATRMPELDASLVELLCLYEWPLNVRELDLLAQQLTALHSGEPILRASALPLRFHRGAKAEDDVPGRPATTLGSGADVTEIVGRDEVDLSRLRAALRRHYGNLTRAAADAGISRQRAYRLMKAPLAAGGDALEAKARARS